MFPCCRLRRVNRRIVRLGGLQVRCQARSAVLDKALRFLDCQRDLFEEAQSGSDSMFLRFRLRRNARRTIRFKRRLTRLRARYAALGDRLRNLTYKRRFFESKSRDIAYATTFRAWLRAIFRGPKGAVGYGPARNEKP